MGMLDNVNVAIKQGGFVPERAHPDDAGADLRTPISFHLKPGEERIIDTRLRIELPSGYEAEVRSKSGLMTKYSIITQGTVDAGYSGTISVWLKNLGWKGKSFAIGDKIAQLVIGPVETPRFTVVDYVIPGERGDNGFGSTGK